MFCVGTINIFLLLENMNEDDSRKNQKVSQVPGNDRRENIQLIQVFPVFGASNCVQRNELAVTDNINSFRCCLLGVSDDARV
jgi:hypothetical protein